MTLVKLGVFLAILVTNYQKGTVKGLTVVTVTGLPMVKITQSTKCERYSFTPINQVTLLNTLNLILHQFCFIQDLSD